MSVIHISRKKVQVYYKVLILTMGIYFNISPLLYCFIILQFNNVDSGNILVVIPYSGKSHYIFHRPIGLELARRGHNVTVITPYIETEHPNGYHQIKVRDKKIYETIDNIRPNLFDINEITFGKFQNIVWQGSLAISEMTLKDQTIQEFLRINQTFDAVICEHFYLESMYIFAHMYKAPLILISSCGSSMKHNIATRNPLQLGTLHYEFFSVKDPTSFLGRLRNFYYTFYDYLWWRFWFLAEEEKLINKYIPNLPQPVPSLYEMQSNVSLFLMNTHLSFDPPAAYLPNLIEIAGIHLSDEVSALPEDLQKILDNSRNGVIYVNFGSHLKSVELPVDKQNAFINVFKKLKYTVLWKWEEDNFTNITDNVIIRKWLPQKEILAHPNIKVFISHGGLLGTIEAIYHGVPIIGVPIYGDQYNNLLQVQYAGSAKILQYKDINEHNLKIALEDILKDDTYKNTAKELSVRFRDRPMNALDTAMYWIEYVLRNRGANYMKNPAMKLNWFAYNMLDVYGFLLMLLVAVIFVQVKLIKYITNFINATMFSKKFKVKSN